MQIDQTLLKQIVPIKQLQTEHRLRMADQSHIIELRIGDELNASEEHHWFLYLLSGKIELVAADYQPALIKADDERALHPLFTEGEHRKRAVAQTSCQVVRFDRQLFNTFLDQELLSGEELETVEMSEVEGNLFNVIMHAFNVGELKLPSLPDVASKVKQALSDPTVDTEDVAHIVSADPAITARLINAANGPLNRGLEEITSIHAAIVRLGMQTTKELVFSFALKQLFDTKSQLLNQRMQKLYAHSVEIAAISFALSVQSKQLAPDHMLLAGLLHEIGVIPILNYIDESGLIVEQETELDAIIDQLKGVVGSMVVRNWNLPNDLICVVEDAENWQRESGDKLDSCDMIIIAQIYNRLEHHDVLGLPKIEQVPAFKKLFPDKQQMNFVGKVFEQAHHEISAIKQLLKM